MNTYEETYQKKDHFSFGKNWQNFLKTLNDEKTEEAKKSLVEFLGGEENIKGKTFVDIGCGSGLFSLVAYKLGAERVLSIDIDDFSVACATHLREKENNPENWEIKKGSALDKEFITSLGKFDIVYSWGVLHHTGNMYDAFNNVIKLTHENSLFYLAIYNRFQMSFKGGTSKFWYFIKQLYNKSSIIIKKIIEYTLAGYMITMMLLRFQNPFFEIRNYKSNRGMSWYHDIVDWVGGYPYEYAGPDEIINYFGKRGFLCKKLIFRNGIGCNEFLFYSNHKEQRNGY